MRRNESGRFPIPEALKGLVISHKSFEIKKPVKPVRKEDPLKEPLLQIVGQLPIVASELNDKKKQKVTHEVFTRARKLVDLAANPRTREIIGRWANNHKGITAAAASAALGLVGTAAFLATRSSNEDKIETQGEKSSL